MLKSPILITAITIAIVTAKVFYFRYELFNDLSLPGLLVESILWLLPYFVVLLLFKKHPIPFVIIISLVSSTLMLMITWYERYFLIVPSYFDLSQTGQAGSIVEILPYLYAISDVIYFLDTLLLIAALIIFRQTETLSMKRLNIVMGSALVLLSIIIQIVVVTEPIYDTSSTSKKYGYLNTQITQAIQRNFKESEDDEKEFNYEKLIEMKNNEYIPDTEHNSFGLAKDRHLFVIQVESMQEFVVRQEINNEEITPNINKLLGESTEFTNLYQQIGAGNTSDSEWLLHTSLYPKGMEATVNFLNGKPMPSMVDYLNNAAYQTMTFHADKIEYWNRDVLYPVLGFQEVFTDKEIPYEDVIGFGPSDSILIDYVNQKIKEKANDKKRMYANILTLTSHTPFKVPDKDKFLTLPKDYEDTYVGNYLQSVRYTDEQIGRFIQNLKDVGIYEDSVIVIFGDHSGLHGRPMTPNDNKLMASLIKHPYSLKDRFNLPFIVTVPGAIKSHTINTNLGGQIDMMPTILNLMGIEINTPIMGQNIFHYENNLLGMRYYLPGGSFINNEKFYISDNARYPKRFYNLEDMKKAELVLPYILRHSNEIEDIFEISDSLVNQHISTKSTKD